MSSVKPQQKRLGYRKSSKPLMERRRRARINACLAQLRTLLTQANITQSCRRSRLEKADILEMTVRHLKSITSQNKDAKLWSLFMAGYNDCTRQISSFLSIPDTHPLRPVFLHPLREKPSFNTEIVDAVSFDQHQLTDRTASGRCKMGELGTSAIGSLPSISNRNSLSPKRSVYTTNRFTLRPVGPLQTQQKPGPDGNEVWRPW